MTISIDNPSQLLVLYDFSFVTVNNLGQACTLWPLIISDQRGLRFEPPFSQTWRAEPGQHVDSSKGLRWIRGYLLNLEASQVC